MSLHIHDADTQVSKSQATSFLRNSFSTRGLNNASLGAFSLDFALQIKSTTLSGSARFIFGLIFGLVIFGRHIFRRYIFRRLVVEQSSSLSCWLVAAFASDTTVSSRMRCSNDLKSIFASSARDCSKS